jgi:transketolase C-terminal domain/subunit
VLRREGNDVTLVSVGVRVHRALEAAEILEKEGVTILPHLIDPEAGSVIGGQG